MSTREAPSRRGGYQRPQIAWERESGSGLLVRVCEGLAIGPVWLAAILCGVPVLMWGLFVVGAVLYADVMWALLRWGSER